LLVLQVTNFLIKHAAGNGLTKSNWTIVTTTGECRSSLCGELSCDSCLFHTHSARPKHLEVVQSAFFEYVGDIGAGWQRDAKVKAQLLLDAPSGQGTVKKTFRGKIVNIRVACAPWPPLPQVSSLLLLP
jgi:hypothetical protein